MRKTKPKTAKSKVAPEEHPRAWGSELWAHCDEVLSMRRGRKSWKEIAEHLDQKHHVKLTVGTVRNFFVRYAKRLKTKRFPVGYGPEPTAAVPDLTAAPASVPDEPKPAATGRPAAVTVHPTPPFQPVTAGQPTAEDLSKVAKKPRYNPFA